MFGHNDQNQNIQDIVSSGVYNNQGYDDNSRYENNNSQDNTIHPDPGVASIVDTPAFSGSSTPSDTSLPQSAPLPPVEKRQGSPIAQAPQPTPVLPTAPTLKNNGSSHASAKPAPGDEELLSIKQEALQYLTPIVSSIDQSPEDTFRTLMMMIQASDNKSIVKHAYEAAKKIPDEKTRAQALLDIINEINYFTQPQE